MNKKPFYVLGGLQLTEAKIAWLILMIIVSLWALINFGLLAACTIIACMTIVSSLAYIDGFIGGYQASVDDAVEHNDNDFPR